MRTKSTFLISLLTVLMLVSQISRAELVPIEKARLVAKNFYYERVRLVKNAVNFQDIVFDKEEIITDNSLPAVYVFRVSNNNGSLMISAESTTYPILFFTFENNFSLDNVTPTLAYFISHFKSQITEARVNSLPSDEEIDNTWAQYSNTIPKKSTTDITTVGPLLTTTWDQGCNYNALCPTDNDPSYCNHMPTGCVATAMAQLMKYWAWPAQGVGSHTNSSNSALSANFGTTTYAWASMPANVSAANTAVATLMVHAGTSVDMQYGSGGSAASLYDAANALKNYFKYSTTTTYLLKSSTTNVLWDIKIRACLIDKKPVLYGGDDPTYGGHAFVLDGFQYPNYYHINLGWGGSDNAYYYLNSINTSGGNWNNSQDAVINVYPVNIAGNPLGINESDISNSLNLLPNPNNGNFSLIINNEYKGSLTVKIFDITSRLIDQRIINKNIDIITENINLSNLNKGLYFISIENDNSKVTKKFIVE